MKAYSKYKIMVTREGISSESTLPLPKPENVKLAEMDFDWSAENKTAIVKKWTEYFQDKTIPK